MYAFCEKYSYNICKVFLATQIKNRGLDNAFIETLTKLVVMTVPKIWTYPLERYVIQIKRKGKKNCLIASDLDGTPLSSDTNVSRETLKENYDLFHPRH